VIPTRFISLDETIGAVDRRKMDFVR